MLPLAPDRKPCLSPVKSQVHAADDHSRQGQRGSRNVGVDQLVEVMQQEPALVGLDAGLAFEPVLRESQRTGPRKEFDQDSPELRTISIITSGENSRRSSRYSRKRLRSPWNCCASGGSSSRFRRNTATRWPPFINSRTKGLPMKPFPPITRMRIKPHRIMAGATGRQSTPDRHLT
jgi:hypothetical protein